MKIALAQLNPIVGDIAGNTAKVAAAIARAADLGAELAVFSELVITGYPPRDLLTRESFVAESVRAVADLAKHCTKTAALVGYVRPASHTPGRPLENAAALLSEGKVATVHVKTLLPTYDVFDETRYFEPGPAPKCLHLSGGKLGVSICEDLWDTHALGRALYQTDPVAHLRAAGAETIINMSASPFQAGKQGVRAELIARQATRAGATIVYVNQVGGNDELIFDGLSMAIGPDGRLLGRCKAFAEDLLVIDTADAAPAARCEPLLSDMEQLARAIELGLRDYLGKCGFKSVVLGLSGGMDSAIVATLAADAIGPENVLCLALPSRYSSDHSLSDARVLAVNLGCKLIEIPMERVHRAFEQTLDEHLPNRPEITDENVQARIRGTLVMAYSNALGHLPLATGNKSELATGYCTLYGDMNGGLAPIGDVPKTMVYQLAAHLNATRGPRIPEGVFTKAPSAELKPNQTDQDKLPPYEVLDAIVMRFIEREQTAEQIIADGFDPATVRRAVKMIVQAEYKRRQAPPVLKVTGRAFGIGRRLPIACRWAT
jgi:NAD+ synthetase